MDDRKLEENPSDEDTRFARGESRGQLRGANWQVPVVLTLFAIVVSTAYQNCAGPSEVSTQQETSLHSKYHAVSYSSREGAMSCAVVEPDRSVRCSGNFFFSLFPSPPAKSYESVEIPGSAGASKVSNAQYYGCAVMEDRKVKCWGGNDLGQLGTEQPAISLHAVEVPNLDDVKDIATSSSTACALKHDGTVWCWGDNSNGLVGAGTVEKRYSSPKQVFGILNATQISLGANHACAVLASQEVICWGGNQTGQLGHAVDGLSRYPVLVEGLREVEEVTASPGAGFTCARSKSGRVFCWGENRYGQLGNGTRLNSLKPVEVSGIEDARQVSAGTFNTCSVSDLGKVFCWGALGIGSGYGLSPKEIPVRGKVKSVQAINSGFLTVIDGKVTLYHGATGELYGVSDF